MDVAAAAETMATVAAPIYRAGRDLAKPDLDHAAMGVLLLLRLRRRLVSGRSCH